MALKRYTAHSMTKSVAVRLLLSAVCVAAIQGARAQSLLVVNQGDSDMSIVDPKSGAQVATVDENTAKVHGHEIIASPDGRTAYIPIYGSSGVGRPGLDGHEMLVVDLASRKITDDIDFGHGVRPHQPVFSTATGLLYVTTELDKSVTIIDPKTRKIVGSIPTGQDESHMLVLSHDGKTGYTANVGPGTVSVLDIIGRKTKAVIPVAQTVQRIAISTDDKLVFTSDQKTPRLAVIDAATQRVKTWVPLPGTGYGTAATLDGRWLLVTVPSANELAVVDLHSMQVVRHIAVPRAPQEVLVRPDGATAYVSCNASGQVAEINLAQWTVRRLIPTGKLADGLAWAK